MKTIPCFHYFVHAKNIHQMYIFVYIVASELNDPIWHSLEWQIGSFSSEATIYSELNDPIWHSLEWQIGSFSSEATIYICKNINLKSIIMGY